MFKFYLPYYNDEKNYEEFNIVLDKTENVPTCPGIPLKHQQLIANLMRGVTNIDSLLLVHDLGTGKTCTAINSIEQNLIDYSYGMERAIILNRGKAIQNNFIYELVNRCTTQYKIGGDPTSGLSNEQTARLEKKLWSKYYTFDTFELFAKKLQNLTDIQIINRYNNTFFVVDEVHHILNEESRVYQEISRFISILPNKKVLLLSGTPVRDSPQDFIPIINLILKQKINPDTFRERYYDSNGNLTREFKLKLMNKVSYLQAIEPNIKIQYNGKIILDLQKFIVTPHIMSEFQTKIYLEAYNRDFGQGGVYSYSRQAIRFVFPDGTYGNQGYNNYINDKKYTFKPNMITELQQYGTDTNSILKKISELSAKYAYIIQHILEADKRGEKTIVYDDLVKGSGLILFSMLLTFIGFKKHRLITAETTTVSEISKIQTTFNNSVHGDKISVILGSRVIAEGFSFLDVLHEHIVPHWNNTETMQIVARGIRLNSHKKTLEENPNAAVTIYRHVSLPTNPDNRKQSIDYIMTKTSETKDIEINKVIDVIKEVSITCNEFIKRNGGKCFEKAKMFFTKNNIISVGFYEENKIQTIIELFKKHRNLHLNRIRSYIPGMSTPEILKYLFKIIDEKIFFENSIGVKCYINHYRNFFFVIDELVLPDTASEDEYLNMTLSYYCQDIKPYTLYSDNISYDDAVNLIENKDSNKNIQRLIELSLTVKLLDLNVEHPNTVQNILETYKNSYFIDKKRGLAAVWFLADIANEKASPSCLLNPITKEPWREWKKCNKMIRDEIENKRFSKIYLFEQKLEDKGVEYYGLWNPDLKEFCIKKVESGVEEDKRRISSGKRCVNWNKHDLLEIAQSLNISRDWDSWFESSRNYICNDIKQWLSENDLLIENKYCGLQRKKK